MLKENIGLKKFVPNVKKREKLNLKMKKKLKNIKNWTLKNRETIDYFNDKMMIFTIIIIFITAIISIFQKQFQMALWKILAMFWMLMTLLTEKEGKRMKKIAIESTKELKILIEALKSAGISISKDNIKVKLKQKSIN